MDAHGLSPYISDSGEEVARKLAREGANGPSVDVFDPLMGAHNSLVISAVNASGPLATDLMFGRTEDGEQWCPLCFVNQKNPHGYNYDVWLEQAALEQVDLAKSFQ